MKKCWHKDKPCDDRYHNCLRHGDSHENDCKRTGRKKKGLFCQYDYQNIVESGNYKTLFDAAQKAADKFKLGGRDV